MTLKDKLGGKPVDRLICGGEEISVEKAPVFGDDRGYFTAIHFAPDSKRAYLIKNHRAGVIRAFHGHKTESKILFAIRGGFKIVCINMETGDWKKFAITEKGNSVIKIPAKMYHGMVSLSDDSELLIVSNKTFEESKNDDFRLAYDVLGADIWDIEYR